MKQPPSRRVQEALEKEAMLRLARFERVETWNGLALGDPVRIAGHRGTWRFRAHVTNTSNGASWVEVSEVLAAGRHAAGIGPGPGGETSLGGAAMTRTRSFRPDVVTAVRRPSRQRAARRKPPAMLPADPYRPAVQGLLFDQLAELGEESSPAS